jgi:hypothetical protein
MITPSEIRILGLRGLDQREMRDSIPDSELRFESPHSADRSGTSYEPSTLIAFIVISAPVLKGLAAWILKKRHRKDVVVEVEKKNPDGSFERVSVKVHMSDSTTESDVVRAVGDQLGIDSQLLASAMGAGGAKP